MSYDEITVADYEVLSIALEDFANTHANVDTAASQLVIVDVTACRPGPIYSADHPRLLSYNEIEPKIKRETFENLLANNQLHRLIRPKFDLPFKYKVVTTRIAQRYLTDDLCGSWGVVYGAFAITQASRPGFNSDSSEAVVYIGKQAGQVFGYGYYYLLTRKDGKWEIDRRIKCWSS